MSTNGVLAGSGSPIAQKAALLASGSLGSSLLGMIKSHALTAAATLIGAKGGPIGAFLGNKAGAAISSLKAAGIRQTGDLVTEAMLNPALARVLLARVTAENQASVRNEFVAQLARLAVARGAHAIGVVSNFQPPQSQPPQSQPQQTLLTPPWNALMPRALVAQLNALNPLMPTAPAGAIRNQLLAPEAHRSPAAYVMP